MEIERLEPGALDELEPLWSCMRERHGGIGPAWIGPTRERAESWSRRRADYARWLDEDALVLVARNGGRAVGYAFVTLGESDSSTWQLEGRTAELESLAVLPEARGAGVGAALLAAVRGRRRARRPGAASCARGAPDRPHGGRGQRRRDALLRARGLPAVPARPLHAPR